MTYKEYYKSLASEKEILEAAEEDIIHAMLINPQRIVYIKQAAEEACNELAKGQ